MFCHLHVHTEHSLLDGYGSAKKYVDKAKQLGFEYLGISDHSNVDGVIQFQKECKKAGIKSIIGCELYYVPDMEIKEKREKRYHLTVLVKNETGFQNLCKILTLANLKGFYYKPRADFNSIIEMSNGLVFLSGCSASALRDQKGEEFLMNLSDKTKEVYLEVMPHAIEPQYEVNNICLDIAKDTGLKLVATNDAHYIEQRDNVIQEILLAIQTKALWSDQSRFRFSMDTLYLKTEGEMRRAFKEQNLLSTPEYLEAINNTIEVAEKCSGFEIKKKDIWLPEVDTSSTNGEKLSEEDYIRSLCCEGYYDLFGKELSGHYQQRFEEELNLIKSKKFIRYFLVVHELVCWCKENDIFTGPGRGSVGGCLIAYLLGITKIDPIKHGLLFSRFINEDRIDYPDIDIDFEDTKRDLIRRHLEDRYGSNNISSVSTFQKMKGRMTIKDVGRVFDIPYKELDEFSKTIIDEDNNGDSSIITAAKGHPFAEKYPEIIDYASRLEGTLRGTGQHAAALIVSAEDLTQGTRGNLSMRKDHEAINWDKDDAEFLGLMKLDVLALKTLSILSEARKQVQKAKGVDIIYEDLPLNDKRVFEMLSKGETVGIFQFNMWATTDICKKMGIEDFNMMVAALALVRPGVSDSGMKDEFIRRKKGRRWKRKHDLYEEITKDTFGIIIYQEQVMKVIYQMAGLPYSVADKIRKIISKKRDVKEFEQYKQMFFDGCRKQKTMSRQEAQDFWEMLEKHASYSFNESHSCAYSVLAYHCAYMKLKYPAEFICANLIHAADTKKEELIEEAKRLGLHLVLPRVGVSDAHLWVVRGDKIYVPFIEIKGVGEKTAEDFANYTGLIVPVKNDQDVVEKEEPLGKVDKSRPKGFFFQDEEKEKIPKTRLGKITKKQKETKVGKILREIGALGNEPEGDLSKYFSFDVSAFGGISKKYPKLQEFIGQTTNDISEVARLEISSFDDYSAVIKSAKYRNRRISGCEECELRKQAKQPVLSSCGKYNIPIIGEAPGCISGDSMIEVAFRDKTKFPKGIPIKDLEGEKDFYVYSFDIHKHMMVIDKVKRVWQTGRKKIYEVTYEWWMFTKEGKREKKVERLRVTANHMFLLKKPTSGKHDPFKGINNEREIYLSIDQGLKVGHSLQPFYRMNLDYGYIRTADEQYRKEAQVLLEFKLKRKLKVDGRGKGGNCHHKNENKLDDTWDNLDFLTISKHRSLHSTGDKNAMKNPEIKARHLTIMRSEGYRSNMSKIMKRVLRNPQTYQKRLEGIKKSNDSRSATVKRLYDDPLHYYRYLLGKMNSKSFNVKDTWVEEKFKNRFPNDLFPPIENHKIIDICYIGEDSVYDMETARFHNFAVNGVFVHNSSEDEKAKGFIGKAGDLLWDSLDKYKLVREFFHVCNACRCFPGTIKTPKPEHIAACSHWLDDELKNLDAKICLVLGNVALRYIKGVDGGITSLCGTTEWSEEKNLWVCYGLHPSAVLRDPSKREKFNEGIKNFSDKIKLLGGLK
ncbi:MAG: DNA polymerase III subunit alpha [Candidatus Paceibacterota bacterium]|jgi:DNA polymerase-3 subunit alpha